MNDMSHCEHKEFEATVEVNRLEDIGRFTADVVVWCKKCRVKMSWLGLPRGVDLNGAATNTDGTELRAAIHPVGETVPELALGFRQRKVT